MLGGTLPFTTQFRPEGSARFAVARSGNPVPAPLDIEMQLDLTNSTGKVAGSVRDAAAWSAQLEGDLPAGSNGLQGAYTLIIPGFPADEAAQRPAGDGYGSFSVDAKGRLKLVGALGDGTPLTQSASVSRDGDWPFHVPLYGKRGLVLGWLRISTNDPPYALHGSDVLWIKPAPAGGKLYPTGFVETNVVVLGARYSAPAPGQSVANWIDGVALIDGGNISATLSNLVQFSGAQLTAPGNTNRLAFSVKRTSRVFNGTFLHPASRRLAPFKGAFIQLPLEVGGTFGGGWFLGTNESGYIFIAPGGPARP